MCVYVYLSISISSICHLYLYLYLYIVCLFACLPGHGVLNFILESISAFLSSYYALHEIKEKITILPAEAELSSKLCKMDLATLSWMR